MNGNNKRKKNVKNEDFVLEKIKS